MLDSPDLFCPCYLLKVFHSLETFHSLPVKIHAHGILEALLHCPLPCPSLEASSPYPSPYISLAVLNRLLPPKSHVTVCLCSRCCICMEHPSPLLDLASQSSSSFKTQSWAYTPSKPDLKETCAPQRSSQHCLS